MKNTGPARDFGIPFDGDTGTNNILTDVTGVRVGYKTLYQPPDVFSGVTAILPAGDDVSKFGIDTLVFAAWFTENGNGEMTGTTFIEESGLLEGPIMLTNTVSVGVVRNEVIAFRRSEQGANVDPDKFQLYLPVVAETYDGWLNSILGPFPAAGTYPDPGVVTPQHVEAALTAAIQAQDDAVPDQGNVGSGTGMTCYGWKGGIGMSSRVAGDTGYIVGVLVQANQGHYDELVIRGVPVGTKMTPPNGPDIDNGGPNIAGKPRKSSIIVVIATDAPLLPHQLKRLARRATLGVGRTGTFTNNDSGEIFIAFSTANRTALQSKKEVQVSMMPFDDDVMNAFFKATVDATEEAIINALIKAESVTGRTDAQKNQHAATAIKDATSPTLREVMFGSNRGKGS
jgi:D-aminopeptidase